MHVRHRSYPVFAYPALLLAALPVRAATTDAGTPWVVWMQAAALVILLVGCLLLLIRLRRLERYRNSSQELATRTRSALAASGDQLFRWVPARAIWASTQLLSTADEGEAADETLYDFKRWREQFVHPDDWAQLDQHLRIDAYCPGQTVELLFRTRQPSGVWRWQRLRGGPVDPQQPRGEWAGTLREAGLDYQEQDRNRTYERVFEAMAEAVAITDLNFHIERVNPAFSSLTGYRSEELVGIDTRQFDSLRERPDRLEQARTLVAGRGSWQGELWQRRKDGGDYLAEVQLAEVLDGQGQRVHYLAVLSDITDRKRAEAELLYFANYDALTGLSNRIALLRNLRAELKLAQVEHRQVAVLLIDLDRFKQVNDTLGHAAGDQLLVRAAERLGRVVGRPNQLARIGGDEFVVYIDTADHPAEAHALSEKIFSAFRTPLPVAGNEIPTTPSIGVSVYPADGEVAEELLRNADAAMANAKSRGRDQLKLFTPQMAEQRRNRLSIESALRKALERDELSLVYQPKMHLGTRKLTGVEALIRWHSKDLGRIGPDQFIPIAEETGLILPIGEWVLRQAVAQMGRFREQGLPDIKVAVNVSAMQLQRGKFTPLLQSILRQGSVAPSSIEVEITESVLLADPEKAMDELAELRAAQISVAVDDFGTGYSSMAYLHRLPIDTLKIDRAFVTGIDHGNDGKVLVSTIALMAHSLGLRVVAEGVETETQLDYLQTHDCDEIQGFWLSTPLEPAALISFWRNYKPASVLRVVETLKSRKLSD
jgi:diguanylate cyclase (GGDEF)-like protein/PAS domain S-box-containing protein